MQTQRWNTATLKTNAAGDARHQDTPDGPFPGTRLLLKTVVGISPAVKAACGMPTAMSSTPERHLDGEFLS